MKIVKFYHFLGTIKAKHLLKIFANHIFMVLAYLLSTSLVNFHRVPKSIFQRSELQKRNFVITKTMKYCLFQGPADPSYNISNFKIKPF